MKAKKSVLSAIILVTAIIAMIIYSVVVSIAQKPTITEKDFPFSITYELNGEVKTAEGIYAVSFVGNGGYVDPTTRIYEGEVISQTEGVDTSFLLRKDNTGYIILHTRLYADYLMGDTEYDYFSDEAFEPVLTYYDKDDRAYEDAQTLLEQGVKLIRWEYPEPIENNFVFSHIAHLSSEVVLPLLLIAALALLAVILLVKKDNAFCKHRMDTVSVVLNFVIGLVVVPFTTVYGMLSDINGSSAELIHQIGYLVPAITILGLAASVSLRRNGFCKGSFWAQFAGPAVFAVIVLCIMIG